MIRVQIECVHLATEIKIRYIEIDNNCKKDMKL